MIIQKKIIEFLEINYLIVYTFTLFFINFARRAKCRVDSVSPKDLQNKSCYEILINQILNPKACSE